MNNKKQLLNYKQLISKMKDIGIHFNAINEREAIKLLQERNYYYKLSSYRKLFEKTDNHYNIEFAVLSDLAVIDMRLRYLLLDICLDVEHGIKTAFMDTITKNPNIDAYNIVKDYAVYNPYGYKNTINALSKSPYLEDMYVKRHKDIPIWVLIEVMDFGNLSYLVEMYCKQYPNNKRLKKANQLCRYARHIRNACAHSNVLLVDIPKQTLNPSASMLSMAYFYSLDREAIKYRKIHDILSLVILHKEYCSKALRKHRQIEGVALAKRSKRHINYYQNNKNIKEIYDILQKIVVRLSKKW